MIDIHTHILPGMDDGARDMEDALAMAQLAVESGVHTLVATSHANVGGFFGEYSVKQYVRRLEELRGVLRQERIPLTVLSGMEIFTTEEVPEMMEDGQVIPLNHSRYYLMEFDFGIEQVHMDGMLESVIQEGYVPVIAHPERYDCVQESLWSMEGWVQRGCLTQINRGSVFGKFGRRAKECADEMLRRRMAVCIASDAHKPYERTTFMADIKDYMEEQYSFEYARELLYENPLRIIENRSFDR